MLARRSLLASILFLPALPVPAAATGDSAADPFAAVRHLRDPAAIGRRYLQLHPGDLPAARRVPRDVGLAARAIEADFAAGRVTVVDGWVLALTEARLAAAAVAG